MAAGAPLSFGRAAGLLVPAGAEAALLLDGAQGAAGLRAYLTAAGVWAPALRPETTGADLARLVSVDPLAPASSAQAGVADAGARALVLGAEATGFSAPVSDAALARRALEAWLAQLGPVRQTRQAPLKGALASGAGGHTRAGMIAPVAGSLRLLTASGRGAAALVAALAHLGARKADTHPLALNAEIAAALDDAHGPAVLWMHSAGPTLALLWSLEASAHGLAATGALLPAGRDPLFEGAAPAPDPACEAALLCTRAALGRAATPLAARLLRELVFRALPAAARDAFDALAQRAVLALRGPSALRVDRLDLTALGGSGRALESADWLARAAVRDLRLEPAQPLPAPLVSLPGGAALQGAHGPCLQAQGEQAWLAAPCPARPPPPLLPGADAGLLFALRLDTAALGAALGRLTALDALRGEAPATAYAMQLLWGPLLLHAGPLTVSGRAVAARPGVAALELAFPLQR